MHASQVTAETTRTANDLYWGSEMSVNQIAEELDLSKGALYGIIAPNGCGQCCPLCGDEVGHHNRTARERGVLNCPTCEWDGSADETIVYESSTTDRTEDDADPDDSPPLPEKRAVRPLTMPQLNVVTRGALIGATVGLALVLWARRR